MAGNALAPLLIPKKLEIYGIDIVLWSTKAITLVKIIMFWFPIDYHFDSPCLTFIHMYQYHPYFN